MVKLEDIAEITGGSTPKTKVDEYWNGEIVWLSPTDLPEIGEITTINDSVRKITEKGLNSCSAKLLPTGSVVFSSRASIGKIGINEVPVATNQGFVNFICSDEIYNRYLAYTLKYFTDDIVELSNSTTFKEVSRTAIKDFKIPLPSLDEQKAIVAKLDRAQRLIDIDREMLAKYDELIQSVFLDMFGDPVTNPKGWDEVILSEVVDSVQNGIFKKKSFYGDGKKVIWINDFIDKPYVEIERLRKLQVSNKEIDKYKVKYGDVLFCRSSLNKEGIGKASIVPEILQEDILFECHIVNASLNKNKVIPEYFRVLSDMKYFRNQMARHSKTSTMTTISQKGILESEILIPPLGIQNDFKGIFKKIVKERSILISSLTDDSKYLLISLMKGNFKSELSL